MSGRGQVTILVIVGMVLLFSTTLIISAQQSTVNAQLQEQANNAVDEFLEINSINTYVSTCIDSVAKQGLELLVGQGGVIYQDQGGLTNRSDADKLPYDQTYLDTDGNSQTISRDVHYGLNNYVDCPYRWPPQPIDFDVEETSFYPVKRTYIADFVSSYRKLFPFGGCIGLVNRGPGVSGWLGGNDLPALCSYDGANKFTSESVSVCPSYAYDTPTNPTSMQRQLETYVATNIGKCTNFSVYEDLGGNTITVDNKNIEVDVLFQEPRGVFVRANYPFSVQVGSRVPIIKQVSFSASIDVDIRTLYKYMFDVLLQMARDPYYDVRTMWNLASARTARFLQPSYQVTYVEQPCDGCVNGEKHFDDILLFKDISSTIRGQPLEFTIALKERKPVMDLLSNDLQIPGFGGQTVDFQYYVGEDIVLEPQGFDPDGDDISYWYHGWKETFDTIFNVSLCPTGGCDITNYQVAVETLNTKPLEWSRSSLYTSTERAANYRTIPSDIGFHDVDIVVEDEHGKKDYQKVRILIFDLPVVNVTSTNAFSGINDTFASIEDPYIFDATDSVVSFLVGGTLTQTVFIDHNETFRITLPGAAVLTLPNGTFSIHSMYEKIFKRSVIRDAGVNEFVHEMEFIAEQDTGSGVYIRSDPQFMNITVVECLPYKYASDGDGVFESLEDYPVYDYLSGPSFDQPHMCCEPHPPNIVTGLAGGNYTSSTQVCFEDSFITLYPVRDREFHFLSSAYVDLRNGTIVDYTDTVYESLGHESDLLYPLDIASVAVNDYHDRNNDVYNVSYQSQCSGYRGNHCGGELTAIWNTKDVCNDFSQVANQYARCEGPGVGTPILSNFDTLRNTALSDEAQCEAFDAGRNFEKDSLLLSTGVGGGDLSAGQCAPKAIKFLRTDGSVDSGALSQIGIGPNRVNLRSPRGIPLSQYDFVCDARCNGDGACLYHEKNRCMCTDETHDVGSTGDSQCVGLIASNFFVNDDAIPDTFYCDANSKTTQDVCLGTCEYTERKKEACYCEHNAIANNYVRFSSVTNFQRYFDDLSWSSNWQSTTGRLCCTGTNTITKTVNDPTNPDVCYRGAIKSSGSYWSSSQLYTQGGKIYACCADPSSGCFDSNAQLNFRQGNGVPLNNRICYSDAYRTQGQLRDDGSVYLSIQGSFLNIRTVHECCNAGSCDAPGGVFREDYSYCQQMPGTSYFCGANGVDNTWDTLAVTNYCAGDDMCNPCNLDSSDADCDGDGLNNGDEIIVGSNTCIVDTDGDGVRDGVDTNPLDPCDPDTSVEECSLHELDNSCFAEWEDNPAADSYTANFPDSCSTSQNDADCDGDGTANGLDASFCNPCIPFSAPSRPGICELGPADE